MSEAPKNNPDQKKIEEKFDQNCLNSRHRTFFSRKLRISDVWSFVCICAT